MFLSLTFLDLCQSYVLCIDIFHFFLFSHKLSEFLSHIVVLAFVRAWDGDLLLQGWARTVVDCLNRMVELSEWCGFRAGCASVLGSR